VRHWLPTRDYDTILRCREEIPPNLRIRLAASRVDGKRPRVWPTTSTVTTKKREATRPTSKAGGNCGTHGSTECRSETKHVAHLRH
jgi:hypothetical protein